MTASCTHITFWTQTCSGLMSYKFVWHGRAHVQTYITATQIIKIVLPIRLQSKNRWKVLIANIVLAFCNLCCTTSCAKFDKSVHYVLIGLVPFIYRDQSNRNQAGNTSVVLANKTNRGEKQQRRTILEFENITVWSGQYFVLQGLRCESQN